MKACGNILVITTTVNLPADTRSEFVEVSLGEGRQVGHCRGAVGLIGELH